MKDTVILYRNNISSVYVANELIKENITFYTKDTVNSFFNHWVVKDILDFFELAQDLTNIDAFENIYYRFKAYISKNDMESLRNSEIDKSVFLLLSKNSNIPNKRKHNLMEFEQLFTNLSNMNPYQAIKSILTDLNYRKYLNNCTSSQDNINGVIATVEAIAADLKSIDEFKDRLILINSRMIDAKGNQAATLTLSTIHGVKGLEFENVFMIDLIDGIIPCKDSIMKLKERVFSLIEEERRLMYVGMTRARKNLFLLYPESKSSMKVTVSRFVTSINSIVEINNYKILYKLRSSKEIKSAKSVG